MAATRSVPECSASAIRPSEPVARPAASLTATRTTAATTDSSAVRSWPLCASGAGVDGSTTVIGVSQASVALGSADLPMLQSVVLFEPYNGWRLVVRGLFRGGGRVARV